MIIGAAVYAAQTAQLRITAPAESAYLAGEVLLRAAVEPASAVKDVADTIYREAKEQENDEDAVAAKTMKAVSRALYALQGSTAGFESIKSYSHSIAEDGDLQSDTLIFTKTDGSLVVFAYTNFPF